MRGLEQPGSFLFVPKRSMVGREKSPVWRGPVAKNLLVSTSLGGRSQEGQQWVLHPQAGADTDPAG